MDVSAASAAVLETLTRACSQEAHVLKPAVDQLHTWENQPGFYSILASVFLNQDLDIGVRLLAVLYFKNGVDRYWRRHAPSAISEDEKETLRRELILRFNEPVNQIATQLSVLIGKISRLDCPRHWPRLIPALLEAIRDEDDFRRRRATLTFYHVVKSLASRRLAADKKIFEELTSEIFSFIFSMWASSNAQIIDQSDGSIAECSALEQSTLYLKTLRKLLMFGFTEFSQNESAVACVTEVFRQIEVVYHRSDASEAGEFTDVVQKRTKLLTLLSKLLLDVQTCHPSGYLSFIRPSLQLVVTYNCAPQPKKYVLSERFAVNIFNLMRNIIRCEKYRPAKIIEDTKNPLALEAHRVRSEFFTENLLRALCRHLVVNYFLMSSDDLVSWDTQPETYVSEESGDSMKFSLRPCTESLCLTLMKEYRETVSSVILELLQQCQATVDPTDLHALLKKDAVYFSVGLASYDLYDLISFDEWFTSTLTEVLANRHPNYRVLRRRVIWLIGCWVGVKFSVDLRPRLYECLVPLLHRTEDLVVRIEAANTLKSAVDDLDFAADQFLPYLETIFGLLFNLLQEVQECETKMTVLHVMSFIIERMNAEIRPFANSLIAHLPQLWNSAAQHDLLRCAIITTLTKIVQSLGSLPVSMYDILVPVIEFSTDVQQAPHIYLYVDGLDLWLATLQACESNTPAMPRILRLFQNIFPLLELGSETLPCCLKIMEAYILLDSQGFLQMFHTALVPALISTMSELKMEGIVLVRKVILETLRVSPEQGAAVFGEILFDVFKSVFETDQTSPMLIASNLDMCSRVILTLPQLFFSFIDRFLATHSNFSSSAEVLKLFLERWFEQSDMIVEMEGKKLCALALCSLLTSQNSAVLEEWSGIINNSVEVLHDVCRSDSETGVQADYLVMNGGDALLQDELHTAHDKRQYQVSMKDPVHSVSLVEYLKAQLNILHSQLGNQSFTALMQTTDSEIYAQLGEFIRNVAS